VSGRKGERRRGEKGEERERRGGRETSYTSIDRQLKSQAQSIRSPRLGERRGKRERGNLL
jgi:hypothetical protein